MDIWTNLSQAQRPGCIWTETWLQSFGIICKHGSYGMVTVIWAPKPWLVGLPLGILLYTNREYHHKPIYKDPPFFGGEELGSFPWWTKITMVFAERYPGGTKELSSKRNSTELSARTKQLMTSWSFMPLVMTLDDFGWWFWMAKCCLNLIS